VRRCVRALLLIATIASCADLDSNSFRVVRDGEELRYDKTTIRLKDDGSQTILSAWNTRDPIPDAADDEYSDCLEVAFSRQALAELAIEQDHPISGEGSWDSLFGVTLDEVTFTADPLHTKAAESMLFAHWCFGCLCCEQVGSQTIRGTLRLTVNDGIRLAGTVEVRVEGDVPGSHNKHQFYDLSLMFDQSYSDTGS
jgi:hypothetical protein